ncbi:MAG TPA: VWA domain-containing protein, partial [Candidatus Sulfopaludibacter sp.]|nr:VWA domain-containing protein [Candidatus Sulfopaludibacter sp.]
TSNGALDGKYRRVKVALAPERTGTKLAYRTGYYAGKVFAKFTAADKERQLEDALMLGDPITDLTIQLEVNYFQLNSAEYFVPIAAKIPGRELALAKKGGAERSLIDFIGEIKDEYGTTVSNMRDKVELKLSGETAAQLAKAPIEFTAGFTLLPGKYTIKLLARDSETGRIGTYISNFTIPNLMKMADRLPISTVVLSSQKSALATALYNANKDTARDPAQANNPLVENGQELMPSVTRVFSRQGPMYVYLQAYEHGATAMQPLEAYVTFYPLAAPAPQTAAAGATIPTPAAAPAATTVPAKFFETPAKDVNTGLRGRAGAVPIALDVPLDRLTPGKYTCQVTVLDPGTQRANFWRGEIEIRP